MSFGISAASAAEPLLAFPSAEGFGRFTLGVRAASAPEVYHVTNLDDSGTGSLRDAVSKDGRIVVFDVSGIIKLKSTLVFKGNSIIAGQTAPGDGVVVYGDRVSFSGAKNLIIRHMRFRMGKSAPSGKKDAAGVANGTDMIFDHLSISWGRDETFSISWDNKGSKPANITIQNSIIGQGLHDHSCGGLIQTDGGVTLFRNLYIDNKTRNPKVKGLNQFVNNVVYNWGGGGGYIMGDSEGNSWAAVEDNYFIGGPNSSGTSAFTRGTQTFQIYQKGNYIDADGNGQLGGSLATTESDGSFYGSKTVASHDSFENLPVAFAAITQQTSAKEAYNYIVKEVGASYPARDDVDKYMIDELTSLGKKGAIISDEASLSLANVVGNFKDGTKTDTDKDGIPDEWEEKMGLNKNDPSDALKKDASGYLNMEIYLNGLVDGYTKPVEDDSTKVPDIETPADSTEIGEIPADSSEVEKNPADSTDPTAIAKDMQIAPKSGMATVHVFNPMGQRIAIRQVYIEEGKKISIPGTPRNSIYVVK
ncbi:hypothetical protein B7993_14280 [Fibrobacter sp. UWH3]|nr:hypothetical protein B7993_14280 [Fibrobacter sp. UWH3]